MSADLDPYYTWLGIPPEEQPPNHYRLLGVKPLETNVDVIANAADRQVMHIRTFQQGKLADQSQAVLNKLSAARVCLLNAESKSAYDRQLRQQLEGSSPAKPAPAPAKTKPLATAKALPTAAPLPEAPAPMVTSLPMIKGWVSWVTWSMQRSCTFVRLPILIWFTSPRTTAWNHTLQSSPSTTSPMTMPVSSIKQDAGMVGLMP